MLRARNAAIAMLVASASVASADDAPAFTIGSQPSWVLLGGATAGATVAPGDRGALVGGEVSFARLRDASFTGVNPHGYSEYAAWRGPVTEVTYAALDGGYITMRFAKTAAR